jgi:hypothetical protein
MEASDWRDDELDYTINYIKESANEILFIRHLRTCGQCKFEAKLSVERYGGRGLPWFLDLVNDVCQNFELEVEAEPDPRFVHCPRLEDYEIGSYWEDLENARRGIESQPKETLKFIEDRCKWAEELIKKQIIVAAHYYKQLKSWDLEGQPPSQPELPY